MYNKINNGLVESDSAFWPTLGQQCFLGLTLYTVTLNEVIIYYSRVTEKDIFL